MRAITPWFWQFDKEHGQLELHMGEVHFAIAYKRRLLQQNLPSKRPFSISDARVYQDACDYLEDYSTLNVNEQLLAAIHVAAVSAFAKPAMPQSWYFQFGDIESWPGEHRACCLDSGLQQGEFLIVEQDERSSLCLLLDESMELSPAKKLRRFDIIKVLNDRLLESANHPFPRASDIHSLA